MSEPNQAVILLYIDAALEALQGAQYNFDGKYWAIAASRAYYACFYAVSALLLTKDIHRSKHSAVLAAFRQEFVKPGLVETEYSDSLGRAFETRQMADYDLAANIDELEAAARLSDARRFVDRVIRYLEQRNQYDTGSDYPHAS
jgi:uncharacterized protein (UPF0332 family)